MTTKAYFLPQSINEAVELLDEHGADLLVMAGGTLAMPLINEGISQPEMVMGLRQAGLNTIEKTNGTTAIGAAVTFTQILAYDGLDLLKDAAQHIGGWAIRNMGTVGGNLFAPPPSGDFAAALLALDASIKLVSKGGERTIPLEQFYTGFMTNILEPGELVTEVLFPDLEGEAVFIKYGRKQANTPAIVTVIARVKLDDGHVSDARLALNGVGSHPFRAVQAETALRGAALNEDSIAAAARIASEECEPFTDAIASEWYRRKMVGVYVNRALTQVVG